MSTPLMCAAALVVVESIMLVMAAFRPGPFSMRGRIIIVNMLVLVMFGPLTNVGIDGARINAININYATVIITQFLILELYGSNAAKDTVPMVVGSILTFAVLSACLSILATHSDTDQSAALYYLLSGVRVDMLIASLLAFSLSTEIVRRAWPRIRHKYGPLPAVILASVYCQVIDTPIFYSIGYYNLASPLDLINLMVSGFATKWVATLSLIHSWLSPGTKSDTFKP